MAKAIRPAPRRTAWQWADAKRVLPPGSPEPGPWNSNRAPWVKGITHAVADPLYKEICAVLGAQMSKTDGVLLNCIGWKADEDPGPAMYVGPTRKNVESISKDRFSKLVKAVPSLWEALAKGKKETIHEKFINGQRLGFGWAGSATELASHPVKDVYIDELDRMTNDVGGEGDPYTVVGARISNYIDGNISVVSTPTVGQAETYIDNDIERWALVDKENLFSPIWLIWQQGERFEWAWPCPECHQYFIARQKLLFIPDEATPTEAKQQAHLICGCCGCAIYERSKEWMNDRGVFIAPGQKPTAFNDQLHTATVVQEGQSHHVPFGFYCRSPTNNSIASFWVSGLCSPWQSFGDRARELVAAQQTGKPGKVQGIINTRFGELFAVVGDAPEWKLVFERQRPYYLCQIPAGVKKILMGVDVQGDRLVYVVRGFGYHFTSWLLDYGEILGETEYEAVWHELAAYIQRPFAGQSIHRVLIDSGFKPGGKNNPKHMVYEFARRFYGYAIPTKGRPTQDKPYKFSEIDQKGHAKQPLKRMLLDTDHFKSWVHNRLAWPEDQAGAWFVPMGISDDYAKQVTAEARSIDEKGTVHWMKIRTHNHYFDAEVLVAAGAHLEQVHRLPPTPLDLAMGETSAPTAENKPLVVSAPPRPSRKRQKRRGALSECKL